MHWKPSSRLNTYFDFVFGLNFIMTRIKNIKVASNLKCSQFYVDVSNTQTLLIHSGCTYFPPVINQTPSCIRTIKWYLINASCTFPVINQMPSCSRTFGWYLSPTTAPTPRLQIILIYDIWSMIYDQQGIQDKNGQRLHRTGNYLAVKNGKFRFTNSKFFMMFWDCSFEVP